MHVLKLYLDKSMIMSYYFRESLFQTYTLYFFPYKNLLYVRKNILVLVQYNAIPATLLIKSYIKFIKLVKQD